MSSLDFVKIKIKEINILFITMNITKKVLHFMIFELVKIIYLIKVKQEKVFEFLYLINYEQELLMMKWMK